jgi:hypothetical protein
VSSSLARVASLALITLLAACSSGGGNGNVGTGPPSRCEAAPATLTAAVSTGLLGGTHLSRARMILDPERENVWLLAAEIDGPGVDDAGDIGVWATNRPNDPGTVYAVDSFAGQFSDWAQIPDPSVSEWQLARSCLE